MLRRLHHRCQRDAGVRDFAEAWIRLVNEGFPSMAVYEEYRMLLGVDPAFNAADQIRDESHGVIRYEQTFMRPLLG